MPALPAIVATNVPDTPEKVFLGGLPAHLGEEQVKELLSAFGQLKAFNLVKDTQTSLSKGFAFCEYVDPNVTDRACSGLNGMKLGDKQLLVQRASIGAKNPLAQAIMNPTGVAGASEPLNVGFLNMGIPAIALLNQMVGPQPQVDNLKSRVLRLLNMANTDDLKDEDEYQDTILDVREECEKYGAVRAVILPRPIEGQKASLICKIYVEFERLDDCAKAQLALGGRRYNGRTVITSLFSEDMFNAQMFN